MTTLNSPLTGTPYPSASSNPISSLLLVPDAVLWLEKYVNTRFASTAARDAAIPVPEDGMVAYITGTPRQLFIYNGSTSQWELMWQNVVAYTPTLTASTTSPTMGTGASLVGNYKVASQWVNGTVEIIAGSTFSAGSGSYRILAPPVGIPAAAVAAGRIIGDGVYFDATGNFYHVMMAASTTTAATMILDNGGAMSATSPVVPAASDQWRIKWDYSVV